MGYRDLKPDQAIKSLLVETESDWDEIRAMSPQARHNEYIRLAKTDPDSVRCKRLEFALKLGVL